MTRKIDTDELNAASEQIIGNLQEEFLAGSLGTKKERINV